jgi:hypothetical protein
MIHRATIVPKLSADFLVMLADFRAGRNSVFVSESEHRLTIVISNETWNHLSSTARSATPIVGIAGSGPPGSPVGPQPSFVVEINSVEHDYERLQSPADPRNRVISIPIP